MKRYPYLDFDDDFSNLIQNSFIIRLSFWLSCKMYAYCVNRKYVCIITVRWKSQHRVILIPEIPTDDEKTNPMLAIKNDTNTLPNLSNISDQQVKKLLRFISECVN